jgi:hypothetical protein
VPRTRKFARSSRQPRLRTSGSKAALDS